MKFNLLLFIKIIFIKNCNFDYLRVNYFKIKKMQFLIKIILINKSNFLISMRVLIQILHEVLLKICLIQRIDKRSSIKSDIGLI